MSFRITACLWLLPFLSWSPVAIGVDRITACHCDALSDFVAAAEQRSLAAALLLEGSERVLVVNPDTATSKLFEVTRWRDPAVEPDMELVPAGIASNGRELIEVVSDHFRVEALEVPLRASDRRQAQHGIDVARSLMEEITSGVSTAAIGLPTRSASALLGPYDSPAGLNRIRLKNALNHHFHQAFLSMAGETYNLTQRVADAILIDFSLSATADVVARFPDGSRVTVQINRWRVGLEGSRALDLDLLTETVSLP